MDINFQPHSRSFMTGQAEVASLLNPSGNMIGLYLGEQPVIFQPDRSANKPDESRSIDDHWTVTDTIETLSPGLFCCTRVWQNRSGFPQEVALVVDLHRTGKITSFMIPAVSYNGNPWGNGKDPKGLVDQTTPGSPAWAFGGDRTSLPACTMTQSNGYAAALFTTPEMAAQSACSLIPGPENITHRIWWPLQERPRAYTNHDQYGPMIAGTVYLQNGESCSREFFISIQPAFNGPNDYAAVLNAAWVQFRKYIPPKVTPDQAWRLSVQYAKDHLWVENDEFRGFLLGLVLKNGQWVWPSWTHFEIGWCGQNSTLACMMLQDFLWNKDEESWRRGESALDFWANHGRFSNGLFFTVFDEKIKGNDNPRLDTCNLGGAAYFYFLAADLADKAGRPKPLWREMALGLCDFFACHALPDGRFGRYWKANGDLIEADGTSGCWIAWPMIKAYRVTQDERYLAAAIKGFRYYADHDLSEYCITAGALDTDCIDKESAFPLLVCGLDLFEITGDSYYLHAAEKAAQYMASWQWHYTLAYPNHTAAHEIGYDTFGGTSVSVQHHHIDPYAVLIAVGWLRLGKITGQSIWLERAAAAWRHGTMGVSDGTLTIQGVLRPAGSQDEGFLHTRWQREPGSVTDWLVAWPAAFRLVALQMWQDWKIFE